MTTLYNHSEHLTAFLLMQCLSRNQINHIDKQQCGNGLSYIVATHPPKLGKVTIIISPSRQFCLDKQKEFGKRSNGLRYKYFYGKSEDTSVQDADILFFVADSFFRMHKQIATLDVDICFIDEYHTIEFASSYRPRLTMLLDKVQKIIKSEDVAYITGTATPNIYSRVDIRIENTLLKPSIVNYSVSRILSVERIKNDIKKGKPVIIGTNDVNTIVAILGKKNNIHVNWLIGKTLYGNCAEYCDMTQDDDSLITICSSASFEGVSIRYNENNFGQPSAYLFSNRDLVHQHENVSPSDNYQFFNRERGIGCDYMEFCRQELKGKTRTVKKREDIEYFVNRMDISTEKKMSKKYKEFHNYVVFKEKEVDGIQGKFYKIDIDECYWNIQKETRLFDLPFRDFVDGKLGKDSSGALNQEYQKIIDFFKDRKVSFRRIDIGSIEETVPQAISHQKTKIKQLKANEKAIIEAEVFGDDFRLIPRRIGNKEVKLDKYVKYVEDYLRKKHYDGSPLTFREQQGLNILLDEKLFNKICRLSVKRYNETAYAKYRQKLARQKIAEYQESHKWFIVKWILALMNDKIELGGKRIGWREYNLSLERKMEAIDPICELMDIRWTSVDLRQAFVRILHNYLGVECPKDIYGVDKKDKVNLNIALNSFKYDVSKNISRKSQRDMAIKKLQSFNFNPIVVDWLINNFFETNHRGDLFTFLSYYEYKIIHKAFRELQGADNDGVVKRADEIIIFNNRSSLAWLNNLQFKGFNGYFQVEDDEGIIHNPYAPAVKIEMDVAEVREVIQNTIDKYNPSELKVVCKEEKSEEKSEEKAEEFWFDVYDDEEIIYDYEIGFKAC